MSFRHNLPSTHGPKNGCPPPPSQVWTMWPRLTLTPRAGRPTETSSQGIPLPGPRVAISTMGWGTGSSLRGPRTSGTHSPFWALRLRTTLLSSIGSLDSVTPHLLRVPPATGGDGVGVGSLCLRSVV